MPLSAKHKDLLERFDKRSKELTSYLESKGDNITAADFTAANVIRDDLRSIKASIESEKQLGELHADAKAFRGYMEDPSPGGHPGHATVTGAQRSGHSIVTRSMPKHTRQAVRLLEQRGAGVLTRENGYSARAAEAICTREYRNAWSTWLRRGERGLSTTQFRVLEDGLDPQGGFLAPAEMIARLIQKKPSPTRVAGLVETVNCSSDACSISRVNYTTATDDPQGNIYSTGVRATLTDENPTSDTQANVNDANMFGSVRISNYTWLLEAPLTNNIIEDAWFDPVTWMVGKFGLTADLLKDNMIINGSGISQPYGFLANPGGTDTLLNPAVITSGAPTAPFFTADQLINITEDIAEQYDEGIHYLYKRTTSGKYIRTLKDANGRYLFSKGAGEDTVAVGRVQSLNGYPTLWSQFMPDPATSAYPLIAGDFGAYTLINRVGFSVQVLREVGARRNQVILLGRLRFGGQPTEPWRVRIMQCAA